MYIIIAYGIIWNPAATGTSFIVHCYIYKVSIKGFNRLGKMSKCEVHPWVSSETEKMEWSQDEGEL